MRTPQSAVAGIAAEQHGLFTFGQALDAGLSAGVLQQWLVTGTVIKVHQSVYRYAGAAESWQGRLVAAVAGHPDADAELAPPRPGDLARSALDPSRARTELGWEPRVTLDEGVARTVDWFRLRA